MKRIICVLATVFVCLSFYGSAEARENVDYWYIKDFESKITVNTDSSLDITEYITADCGTAQKHGIYRVLPTQKTLDGGGVISMPIKLISITDFDGKALKYQVSKNNSDHILTWKIGDSDVYVSGVNYYKIHYQVKNTILHDNAGFDELYWNLSGNFWDIPIDHFRASISLPDGIDQANSSLQYYSGAYGEGDNLAHTGGFSQKNQVDVEVLQTMNIGEGITISLTFPQNIVLPYIPTFWEKYGAYLFFLLPILFLYLCIRLWRKYGKDPRISLTIAPEFEVPEKLCPIDMNIILKDGNLEPRAISASIINLAVSGRIKIEKIDKKGVFAKDDFKLTMLGGSDGLSASERELFRGLFDSDSKSVILSSKKNKFFKKIPEIKSAGEVFLTKKKWLVPSGRVWQITFISFSVFFVFLSFVFYEQNQSLGASLMISGLIVFIFSFLMRSRTEQGAILNRRILGFKLYMKTVERYRQKFNEKENIFERFLPYAILFGIVDEWANKMKEIYGEKYFNTYHPVWFIGPNFGSFNISNLTSEITAMSSSMASTMASSPSSSGAGGGGFSGGGGGGGGGGGW